MAAAGIDVTLLQAHFTKRLADGTGEARSLSAELRRAARSQPRSQTPFRRVLIDDRLLRAQLHRTVLTALQGALVCRKLRSQRRVSYVKCEHEHTRSSGSTT